MGIFHTKCNSKVRLEGKTAVITGCNTGIGKATAMDFYKRGSLFVVTFNTCPNWDVYSNAVSSFTPLQLHLFIFVYTRI